MALVDGKGDVVKPAVERKNPGKGSRDRLRDEGFVTPDGEMRVKVEYAENGGIRKLIVVSKAANDETGIAREKYEISLKAAASDPRRTDILEDGETLILKVADKHGDFGKNLALEPSQSQEIIELGKFLLDATHPANKKPIQEMIATDIVAAVRRAAPTR